MPSALAKNKLDSLELLFETPVNFLALTVLKKKKNGKRSRNRAKLERIKKLSVSESAPESVSP